MPSVGAGADGECETPGMVGGKAHDNFARHGLELANRHQVATVAIFSGRIDLQALGTGEFPQLTCVP